MFTSEWSSWTEIDFEGFSPAAQKSQQLLMKRWEKFKKITVFKFCFGGKNSIHLRLGLAAVFLLFEPSVPFFKHTQNAALPSTDVLRRHRGKSTLFRTSWCCPVSLSLHYHTQHLFIVCSVTLNDHLCTSVAVMSPQSGGFYRKSFRTKSGCSRRVGGLMTMNKGHPTRS